MAEIKLFNKYHGKENTITNYCGLMLKLLYQSSPTNFEKCIVSLIDEDVNIFVEPKFLQQVSIGKKGSNTSIADLRIKQTEYELIFEVKTTDWFHEGQFTNYINNLSNSEIKNNRILFALTDEFRDDYEKFKAQAKENGIVLQLITFSQLLESLNNNKVNDELFLRFLDEFEEFLENENLLASWEGLLDVVNCASLIHETEDGYYACPDLSGAYNHLRSKYFGPYKQKCVSNIFEIDAVVVISIDDEEIYIEKIKYNNTKETEKNIKERALEYFNKFPYKKEELYKYGLQIFLLSNKAEIQYGFNKSSPGGLFGSKKYFKGIAKNLKTAKDLAQYLDGKNWEDFN